MIREEIECLAHFVGIKYLKSTGTWRLELYLFEKDMDLVPEHVKYINKIVKIRYKEYQEGEEVENRNLSNLLESEELQMLLGTNNVVETKKELEKRTGIQFENLTIPEINDIVKKVKKSFEASN